MGDDERIISRWGLKQHNDSKQLLASQASNPANKRGRLCTSIKADYHRDADMGANPQSLSVVIQTPDSP